MVSITSRAVQSILFWSHYLSFYYSVSSASSVVAGVNKALQSVGVFLVSAAVYCSAYAKTNCDAAKPKHKQCTFMYDHKSCLTPLKLTACLVVCACVLLYSFGKQHAKGEASMPVTQSRTEVDTGTEVQGHGSYTAVSDDIKAHKVDALNKSALTVGSPSTVAAT